MSKLIFADDLARTLETTEEGVCELARTRKLPFAISTARPRRLFIEAPAIYLSGARPAADA